jgi:hypothetical protein
VASPNKIMEFLHGNENDGKSRVLVCQKEFRTKHAFDARECFLSLWSPEPFSISSKQTVYRRPYIVQGWQEDTVLVHQSKVETSVGNVK